MSATTVNSGVGPTSGQSGREISESGGESRGWAFLRLFWHIFCYLLLGVVLVLACVTIVIPKVGGAIPMTILSNSMAPTIPTGSLAVVKPTMDPESDAHVHTLTPEEIAPLNKVNELAAGDVIAFQPAESDGHLIIHRIMSISVRMDGSREFITKGDNNATDEVVQDYMVRGKVWYHLPYLGYVNNYVNGEDSPRHLVVIIVAVAFYIWAVVLLWKAFMVGRGDRKAGELASGIQEGI